VDKKSKGIIAFAAATLMLSAAVWLWMDIAESPANSAQASAPETAKPDEGFRDHVRSNYKVFAPPMPDSINFCGEDFDLNELDIYERLDREIIINTYFHSSSIFNHKRAARWFPVIEPILKEEGVPDDMKYLAVIESGLDNVVSPAGARGFWQFMPATAKSYDLEVNAAVDERYNVEKATRAACKLLKDGYRQFGSWGLAAAAYNMGMGGLQKEMTAQGQGRYVDLILPEETMRYVFRILAMKQILTHSSDYGFRFRPEDLYKPYRTRVVHVSAPIADLNAFAKKEGTTLRVLKVLNPWLRAESLPNPSGKTYSILLPDGKFNR
jgi:hypothetical protein